MAVASYASWSRKTARGISRSKRCGRQRDLRGAAAGINDRDAAERLTNLKLYVPRDRLPPTEDDDTFYYADLVG
jgi:16S rRNA processing protein RimM